MAKKIEELMPSILKMLSRGESVSTVQMQTKHGFSASSFREHLRTLKENFFKNDIRYDASSRSWVAIKIGFLDKILLKPEEIVVLNSILRNKNRLGAGLSRYTQTVVENYKKRTMSYILRQQNSEKIDKNMEEKFALIHTAIDEKRKLNIMFADSNRLFYPYKIVNIEYYWYLVGFEESKDQKQEDSHKIKSFALAKIQEINISEDEFRYDFSRLDKRIGHMMNAYFSFKNSITVVQLLVHEDLVDYIDRAMFFSSWRKIDGLNIVKSQKYIRYDVDTSDEYFRDIIPTVLKYLPKILIEEPDELRDMIAVKLDEYKINYT